MVIAFIRRLFVLIFFVLIFYFGLFHFSQIDSIDLKIDPSLTEFFANKNFEKKIKNHLSTYKGKFIWKVNLKKMIEEIKKIYTVGNIYIVRRLPNRVIVFLEKDDPVAIILKNNKDFFSISYDGEIRYKLDYNQSLNFPILRGRNLWRNKKLRKQVMEFLSFLPREGFLTLESISEIRYNKKNDSFILYLIPENFTVEWKGSPSLKKIQNINFVLNYMGKEGYLNYYVDARFDKKIIVNKSK